jgi:hypothetical protein
MSPLSPCRVWAVSGRKRQFFRVVIETNKNDEEQGGRTIGRNGAPRAAIKCDFLEKHQNEYCRGEGEKRGNVLFNKFS